MGNLIIKGKGGAGNKLIIQDQAGAAVLTTADSGATASNVTLASTTTFPTGSVIQVVSTTKTNYMSTANADYFAIPGLNATITPKSTSNKILVSVHIGKVTAQIADGQTTAIQIRRGTTAIGGGATSGSQTSVNAFINSGSTNANYAGNNMSCQFLDSPSTTSATTYNVYITGADGGNFSVIINGNINNSTGSAAYEDAASSTITLMEIVG